MFLVIPPVLDTLRRGFKSSQTDQEELPKQISMFEHLRRFRKGSRDDKFAATFHKTE